jgi:hypothetical protein
MRPAQTTSKYSGTKTSGNTKKLDFKLRRHMTEVPDLNKTMIEKAKTTFNNKKFKKETIENPKLNKTFLNSFNKKFDKKKLNGTSMISLRLKDKEKSNQNLIEYFTNDNIKNKENEKKKNGNIKSRNKNNELTNKILKNNENVNDNNKSLIKRALARKKTLNSKNTLINSSKKNKFESSNSIQKLKNKKIYDSYNSNKNPNKKKQINEKNEKNLKEKSDENSINASKKNIERTNKKINNLKKPLFHSNSTRDIYSAQSNIEKYLKKKINQLQSSHNFKNSNNQVKPIIKSQKTKSKLSSNLIPPSSTSSTSKGTTSASININNYYTNHIYNSIYNNFMPHQLYDLNSNINKKINHQRASSVLTSKRSSSKYQSNIKKIKGKQVHNCKNKEKKVFNNIPTRKMSRTNSKVNIRPSSEFTFNKTKSISIYNHHKKV